MVTDIFKELTTNSSFYLSLTLDHLMITGIAALIAIVIGGLIGIGISERPHYAPVVISVVNIAYTIPSIALLGVFISITGIGNTTAIIVLTIYALLPVVRNTYIGLTSVDQSVLEAALAMGNTERQMLLHVKLPLALPVIFSGIRNMLTMTIAMAGIASFVGAGGLGVAVFRGITTNNKALLISGSLLIALLALVCDGGLGLVEKGLTRRHHRAVPGERRKRWLAFALVLLVGIGALACSLGLRQGTTVNIASKPTTESYILAEIAANLIEEKTDLNTTISHGIAGGTGNIHPAMVKGDFDIYPEYTGTAWQNVLKDKTPYKESRFPELKKRYEQEYGLTWCAMLGFNNTYSLAVRKDLAQAHGLANFSDLVPLAPSLIFGANYDFFERQDGYPALIKAYGLNFKQTADMDNGLKYQALFDGQIDVMSAFTTDGQLSDPRVTALKDDLAFYPSYQAGFVVRTDVLADHPELKTVLNQLSGQIDEATMSKMNYAVEVEKKTPQSVAKAFLKEKGMLDA